MRITCRKVPTNLINILYDKQPDQKISLLEAAIIIRFTVEENIKEASISSLVSTPRPPRKPLFPLDRFREEANDSSEKLEGENSTRSVHMKISASRLALSLSYFFSSFPSYRLQERSSCGKNAYANTGERGRFPSG